MEKASFYQSKIQSDLRYERFRAKELLPELLETMINLRTDDLCDFLIIPDYKNLDTRTEILTFYEFVYLSCKHTSPHDLEKRLSQGLITCEDRDNLLEEASQYYYLRYLFESKEVSDDIIKVLEEKGFQVGYVEEPNPKNDQEMLLTFLIEWCENHQSNGSKIQETNNSSEARAEG